MKIGYARESILDQNFDREIKELKEAGCYKVFQEKAPDKSKANNEVFNECLSFIMEQDTLVVSSLDRLGHNYEAITSSVTELNKRNIRLMILDMPHLNTNIEDETISKLLKDMIINLLSYVAETERKKMVERQAQGIAVAKEKGIYKGKPLEYSPNAKCKHKRDTYFNIVDDLNNDIPVLQISKKYDVTRKLVYRIKHETQSSAEILNKDYNELQDIIVNKEKNKLIKIRRSKNYGKIHTLDIRTWYSLNKSDLENFNYIQLEIKETDIKIILKTQDIKKEVFDYDSSGKFSIYMNQDENKDFYITRLGSRVSGISYKLLPIPGYPNYYKMEKH